MIVQYWVNTAADDKQSVHKRRSYNQKFDRIALNSWDIWVDKKT